MTLTPKEQLVRDLRHEAERLSDVRQAILHEYKVHGEVSRYTLEQVYGCLSFMGASITRAANKLEHLPEDDTT